MQRWEENKKQIQRLTEICQLQQQLINVITKARNFDNPMHPFGVTTTATKVRKITETVEDLLKGSDETS